MIRTVIKINKSVRSERECTRVDKLHKTGNEGTSIILGTVTIGTWTVTIGTTTTMEDRKIK